MGEFQPRRAIVTAGDSGIGKATAVALAQLGCDVGVTWHSDDVGAKETADEITSLGRRAEVRQLDLSRLPQAADVVDELAEALGGVDVFVNNAGGAQNGPALEMSYEEWTATLDLNLSGAFLCAQRAARRMVAAGNGGRIINVTSVHQLQPRVGSVAYDAAKGGLGMVTSTLALELGRYGITVNAVAPGEIATPLTGNDDPHSVSRPGVPLGRPGDAREVAAVVAFLAGPTASYVTGATYPVDGGMLQMGPHAGSHIGSDDWRDF